MYLGAVESVVMAHLLEQLEYLNKINDAVAWEVVNSIIKDEMHHRDVGHTENGLNIWFKPLRVMISFFTEKIIRFGMR